MMQLMSTHCFCLTLVMSGLISFTNISKAENVTIIKTKNQIKTLDYKIDSLKKNLNSVHNKQDILQHELASTEKKIGKSVWQLQMLQRNIGGKQHKIKDLQRQVHQLDEQLHNQQAFLARHICARYKMGAYQPLKWLLNQDTPQTFSRLISLYQYIIRSRQHTIDAVHKTQLHLTSSRNKLKQEMNEQQQLQRQLVIQQQKLEREKLYSKTLLQSLNQDIHSKQQILAEYQHNKENLSRLLESLQHNIVQPHTPFLKMRRKLPKPVATETYSVHKLNQGIAFYGKEGDGVIAVYPGKIVFSDWLKGYGLLLIIDHGQGFMTLYAHNQSLFKQKGELVHQGEKIATIGHSGGLKENGLYFEVRHRGKAIPPLEWLS